MSYQANDQERAYIGKQAGQRAGRQGMKKQGHPTDCRCVSCRPDLWAKLFPEDPSAKLGEPLYSDAACVRVTIRMTPSLYSWLVAMAGDPTEQGRANNGPSAFARRILLRAKEIHEEQVRRTETGTTKGEQHG